MTVFNFIDHDPRTRRRRYATDKALIEQFAQALRDNPEQWAEFPVPAASPTAARTLSARINQGAIGAPIILRGSEFEATAQLGVVYVRYVPGGDQ